MPKYDGIRVMKVNGVLKMRSGKVVPNGYLRAMLKELPDGREGEIIVNHSFSEATSFVRSDYKESSRWILAQFDNHSRPNDKFIERLDSTKHNNPLSALTVPWYVVESLEQLLKLEQQYVSEGYEGIVIRDPDARYKFGTATFKEQSYLTFKRKMTENAHIIGCKCKQEDGSPVDTLGALELRTEKGIEFCCGSGLDDTSRSILWAMKDSLIGKSVEFEYERSEQVKPRFPVFLRML